MKNLSKIDDFLLERLSEAERKDFLAELEQNPSLQKELEISRRLFQGIKAEARKDLKADLNTIHERLNPAVAPLTKSSVPQSTPSRGAGNIRRFIPWAAAACIVLAAALFWLVNTSSNPQELFAQNYKPYELSLVLRDQNAEALMVAANDLYRQGDYEAAIPYFKKLIATSTNPNLLRMGLGVSFMETKNWQEAEQNFAAILQSNDPMLKDQASWYLALIALQQEQTARAITYLTPLADNAKADHHAEAKVLLKKIK